MRPKDISEEIWSAADRIWIMSDAHPVELIARTLIAGHENIRSAYEEGLREGATMASTRYGGKTWEESESKKRLTSEGAAP